MITFIKKFTSALILLTIILGVSLSSSFAAQVSQAQIEQFKKLPPSQQQALAKSMGIDMSSLQGQLSNSQDSAQQQINTES